MPPSAGMGRSANIGLRTPPRHDTITPKSKTVMELLRKAAPTPPGTGMVGRIQHLSAEPGSPLDIRDRRRSLRRSRRSHTPVGWVDTRFSLKQTSYQTRKAPEKYVTQIGHTKM